MRHVDPGKGWPVADHPMSVSTSKISENQLLAEGQDLPEVTKQLKISEATYHRWRAQYGGLKPNDVKRLKELEGENTRLKRIVANKELQIQAFRELGRGNW